MEFTWNAYKTLIQLLKAENYNIVQYHNYPKDGVACAILRHDIDNLVTKAYRMAELENKLDVKATYFVLLTNELYNVATSENVKCLREMHKMGHRIGLHFDESIYSGKEEPEIMRAAERERNILENILDVPIREVSMHRPSKLALEGDWKFETMTNSYGKEFFHEFKYVSDSRMKWREDVEEIIRGHRYQKLHILTHAFWYEEKEASIEEKLRRYIDSASVERWEAENRNIRNLEALVPQRSNEEEKC